MKRMWNTSIAMIATLAMTSISHGQNDWGDPSEIGSYQSILSQAGYGNSTPSVGLPSAQQPMLQNPVNVPPAPFPQAPVSPAPMLQSPTTPAYSPQPMLTNPMPAGEGFSGSGTRENSLPVISSGDIPMMGNPMPAGDVFSGSGMVSGPGTSSPVYESAVAAAGCSSCSSPAYSSPLYSSPVYSTPNYASSPIYTAPTSRRSLFSLPTLFRGPKKANYTLGIYGLAWERDYEDARELAANSAGDKLLTTDADHGTLDGYGVNLAARKSDGSGFEAVYWSLNQTATASLADSPSTSLRGFSQLTHTPTGEDLFTLYNDSLTQSVVRDTDINNIELNLLRNGGTFCTKRGRTGFFELIGGFRWFQFDESLDYISQTDLAIYPNFPESLSYRVETENTLLGGQLGARSEIQLANRLRLFSSVKGGVFNNHIETSQFLADETGVPVHLASGAPFDFSDDKDDISFLGEADLGVMLHLCSHARLRIGYRVIGVTGVALAADQIPDNFVSSSLDNAKSNGSLLLGGAYYGIEMSY